MPLTQATAGGAGQGGFSVRHFDFVPEPERERLFYRRPETFDASSDRNLLAVALGATLYSPATRPALAQDLRRRVGDGALSVVVCLEDSVADVSLAAAENNAITQLRTFAESAPSAPLVFVRVRTPEQIAMIVAGLGEYASVLSGFVLPKFADLLADPKQAVPIKALAGLKTCS